MRYKRTSGILAVYRDEYKVNKEPRFVRRKADFVLIGWFVQFSRFQPIRTNPPFFTNKA